MEHHPAAGRRLRSGCWQRGTTFKWIVLMFLSVVVQGISVLTEDGGRDICSADSPYGTEVKHVFQWAGAEGI